jgi:glycosyltransferase involved in cell wall biosynthesis
LVILKLYIPGAVPSKLYEAMASGRPIVLVARGEAADVVREHRAGIVVEPGDIDGFAGAILALERDPELRRELGENGRRAAEGPFNRATIASDFALRLTNAPC